MSRSGLLTWALRRSQGSHWRRSMPCWLSSSGWIRLDQRYIEVSVSGGLAGALCNSSSAPCVLSSAGDPGYGGEHAQAAFEAMLDAEPHLRDQFERTHKLDPDPRVTRVGRWLRSTSLDELPQLINIIRGDLSIVGPRPVTPDELGRYGESVDQLLSVRPGLTGYWQINGRSALSYDERVRLDLAYVCGWSLALDLKIMAKTSRAVTARAGAV